MAISTEARNDLVRIVVGMFNGAPGSDILSQLTNAFEAGQTRAQIATNLAKTAEYQSLFPDNNTNPEVATKIVNNIVGNLATDAVKADAVALLTAQLNSKPTATSAQKAAARAEVTLWALDALKVIPATDAGLGKVVQALANKTEVAVYYSVDAQQNPSSVLAAQTALSGVNDTAASVEAAKAEIDGGSNPGQSFELTTGIDNLVGTSADDSFGAVVTATSAVLGGLDSIDGGQGNDVLNITDTATAAGTAFTLPAGFSVKNVESVQLATNGGVTLNTSSFTGLTDLTTIAAGTVATTITAAGTTNVDTTVTGAATVTVAGGKAVNVLAGTGAVSVTGAALTEVAVKAADATVASGAVTVNNTGATSVSLKSVTLENVSATAALTGLGLTTLNLVGATQSTNAITVTNNATGGHAFTINASGAGIDANSATAGFLVGGADVNNTTATSLTINSNGTKNSLDVAGFTAAKSVTIAGSAALTLVGGTAATVTSIDGSAATGALTLGTVNTTVGSVKTGSGNDSLTLGAAKAAVETGAGNDTVTLNGALAAGSSIKLGAGNDSLLTTATGSVATSSTTVIDGGEGVNTVAARLINAANAGQFVNFQNIDLSFATGTPLDVQLMTGSTITGLTLSGGAGGATVNNVKAGVGLSVTGTNTGNTTINVKDAGLATSVSDSLAVTLSAAGATSVAAAGTVTANKVEGISLISGGAAGTTANTIALTSDTLKTVDISGARALTVTFVGANGTVAPNSVSGNGVTSIDGSAATGVLNINTTNVTAATAGLTVKGGSAGDTITLAQKATVDAGAGADTIIASFSGATVTGGAGNDIFNFQAAIASDGITSNLTEANGAVKNIINDFSAGDTIKLLAAATVGVLGAKIALDGTVTNFDQALNQATISPATTAVTWFQYAGDTYIVSNDGAVGFTAGDVLIKVVGVSDLSTAVVAAGGDLTI